MKHDNYMYWFRCNYCGMHIKDKNMMSFSRYNDECEGWFGSYTLKTYSTFDKNDQATLKATLDERGLKFPSKHAGEGINYFTKKRRVRL